MGICRDNDDSEQSFRGSGVPHRSDAVRAEGPKIGLNFFHRHSVSSVPPVTSQTPFSAETSIYYFVECRDLLKSKFRVKYEKLSTIRNMSLLKEVLVLCMANPADLDVKSRFAPLCDRISF